jgi:hypothetical protein
MGNKEGDVLLEVIDAFSKKTIGVLPVETGKASFNVFRGLSENDWVALYDTQGRVLVYSLKEGPCDTGSSAGMPRSTRAKILSPWKIFREK